MKRYARNKITIYSMIIWLLLLSAPLNIFAAPNTDQKIETLTQASDSLASQLTSPLNKSNLIDKGSSYIIAITFPKNNGTGIYKTFERRITEFLTNSISTKLPQNFKLSDRLNIKSIHDDQSIFGETDANILEKAGANVHIAGTYTVISEKNIVELNYSTIIDTNTVSRATVNIPMPLLSEGSDLVTLYVTTSIKSGYGRELVRDIVKSALIKSNSSFTILDLNEKNEGDDPFALALSHNAKILIHITLDGTETKLEYGMRKGDCKITATLYQMPKKDTIAAFYKEQTVGTADDKKKPLEDSIKLAAEQITPVIMDKLKGNSNGIVVESITKK